MMLLQQNQLLLYLYNDNKKHYLVYRTISVWWNKDSQ